MKDDNDIAPFKNILNEMYAKDISRKVRSARAVSARQGKFPGSKPPFGYTRCPADKHKLIIDEKPAQIISRMFDMFASGDSGRHISDVFNNEGILSPRAYYYQQIGRENPLNESMTWNSNTVMQLLKNPVYIGNMVQGKRRVTSFKTKSRAVIPEEDWIVVENTHEAIIGKDSWAKVQKKIASGKSPRVTKSGEISLFAGIARCADRGASMTFNTKQYDGRTYYIYKCSRYAVHGKSTCSIHHIPASALEEALLQNIRFNAQLLSENDEELLEKLTALGNRGQQCEMQEAKAKLNEAAKRLEVVENMAHKLFEERCTGNVPDSVFKKLMQNYDIEQANLNQVIAEKRSIFMAEKEGFARRHWGSAAASPGNLKAIHWMPFPPRGDVPFESPLLFESDQEKRHPSDALFLGGEGGIRTLAPVTPAYSLSRGAPYSHLGTSPRIYLLALC